VGFSHNSKDPPNKNVKGLATLQLILMKDNRGRRSGLLPSSLEEGGKIEIISGCATTLFGKKGERRYRERKDGFQW